MSQENVEVVRLTFEAIGGWDIDALLKLYDPEIEYLPLTGARVESGGYVGHAGVREYFEEVAEIWEELHPRADDVRNRRSTRARPWRVRGAGPRQRGGIRQPHGLGAYGPGRQGHPPPRLPNPRGGPRRRGTEGVAHLPDVAGCCAA